MKIRGKSGYSLIEVLIAAAVLMIAIAGAGSMALTVTTQQETNAVIARISNYHEQAARLYQLGLASSSIAAVLPGDPALVSLTFQNESLQVMAGIGTVQRADCVLVFRPSAATESWSAGTWNPGDASARTTNSIVVVRPTIR